MNLTKLKMNLKELKKRWLFVKNVIKLAVMKPKEEMTDTIVIAQWTKYNKSQAVVRSINSLLGLLVGQIAVVKNEPKLVNVTNKTFEDWIADGLHKSLKVNDKNTNPYIKYHTRKTKKRTLKTRKAN